MGLPTTPPTLLPNITNSKPKAQPDNKNLNLIFQTLTMTILNFKWSIAYMMNNYSYTIKMIIETFVKSECHEKIDECLKWHEHTAMQTTGSTGTCTERIIPSENQFLDKQCDNLKAPEFSHLLPANSNQWSNNKLFYHIWLKIRKMLKQQIMPSIFYHVGQQSNLPIVSPSLLNFCMHIYMYRENQWNEILQNDNSRFY